VSEQDERTLYVGEHVSWEAQWSHAVALFNKGSSVMIHDHAADDRCRADGAHCRCGRLTEGTDGPTLTLISDNETDN